MRYDVPLLARVMRIHRGSVSASSVSSGKLLFVTFNCCAAAGAELLLRVSYVKTCCFNFCQEYTTASQCTVFMGVLQLL
jgi:hypothetical protein